MGKIFLASSHMVLSLIIGSFFTQDLLLSDPELIKAQNSSEKICGNFLCQATTIV